MLKSIKIKGLFEQFDYDIQLKKEGLTILTGPNGYGKTTILKILYNIRTDKYFQFFEELEEPPSFEELPFGEISLDLGNKNVIISKDTYYLSSIQRIFPEVYLIQEQRLLKRVRLPQKESREPNYDFINIIKPYSEELSKRLNNILAAASKESQDLDGSFPARLFNENNSISEEDFNKRFAKIKEKRKLLSLYGLSTIEKETHTSFKQENAIALLVYLNDTEKKLSVFDEYLKQLELFSNIINQRMFTNKKMEISPEFGIRFKTKEGKEIPLTKLSSGEQQEIVLFYELIFKTKPDTLVLIDEPEISLHVAWQKEFINDLLKIIELRGITVITATHSPQIIDKHWDLTVDLYDLAANSGEISE